MSKKKVVFISIVVIILGILGVLTVWLYNNTSLFTTKISNKDLAKNNLNESLNYELVPQKINGKTINIPKGFTLSVFAEDIGSARFLSISPDDTLFVGTKDNDKIYTAKDANNDGVADDVKDIDSGLNSPHSVFYYKNDLYVGEENRVSAYRNITSNGTYSKKDVLVDNLPAGNRLTGGGHKTRTVVIGPDEKMYVSIGSSCNVCEENDERRATIMRFNIDGSNGEIFATGLRNTVGFDFKNGQLYGADMGRDQIGDDIPPEEINIIQKNKDYGWPYCYGDNIANPEFPEKTDFCKTKTEKPFANIQAHSAPLGVSFLSQAAQSTWPKQYQDGMLVALHGSWNRTIPTGYKVVYIDMSTDEPKQYNFLSGWLENNAEAWGRPVGMVFDSKGNLYLSDDKQGLIYKLSLQ